PRLATRALRSRGSSRQAPRRPSAWAADRRLMSEKTDTTGAITPVVTTLVSGVRRNAPALKWVSRAGWISLATGIAFLVAGRILGWIEPIIMGAALLLLMCGAALFAIGRHPYAVTLRLHSGRIVVGERAV